MEPNFEVKGSAMMASGMEETESDAAIDTSAKKDGNFKIGLFRHTAR